jgi:hypothetical protein
MDQRLCHRAGADRLERRPVLGPPARDRVRDLALKRVELGVCLDHALHLGDWDAAAAVAGTLGLEQLGAKAREGVPVGGERVEVPIGNPAVEMGIEVLHVLGRAAFDVTRDVEVEVVAWSFDLRQRHQPRVAVDLDPPGKDVDDFVDVAGAEPVLGAVLDEVLGGIEEKE